MKEKLIIFGAGDYGKKALGFYGAERVAFFVDNNETRSNQLYCGKTILSFTEYLRVQSDYTTLVAAAKHNEIEEQLRACEVNDYAVFYPEYGYAYRLIEQKLRNADGLVALVGVSKETEIIYRYMLQFVKPEQIIIAEKGGRETIGTKILGRIVKDYADIWKDISYTVMTPGNLSVACELYCRRVSNQQCNIVNPIARKQRVEDCELVHNPYKFSYIKDDEDMYVARDKQWMNPEGLVNELVEELELGKPLFSHVEIETINRCNLNCSFCPAGASRDTRKKAVMDEELYKSIVDQLAELNYSGRFGTFSNNEPFLDSRIVAFNKYAREKLPNAHIFLATNGTLLTVDTFIQIIPYLDELFIDNYNKDLELNPTSIEIQKYCASHPELARKVTIELRHTEEVLSTRGGDAPNRTQRELWPNVKCALPWFQLIVRPTGELSTCCADPMGTRTMGDLRKQTLLEAWYGEKFVQFRTTLSNGRGSLDRCKYCDAFNLY